MKPFPSIVLLRNDFMLQGVLLDGLLLPHTADVTILSPLGGTPRVEVSFVAKVEYRETDHEPVVRWEECPLCHTSSVVRLPVGWAAPNTAIPIVGCGNPWHYVGVERDGS